MALLEQERSKLAHDLDNVQKKAFTKWINSHLEKVGIEIDDLFQDLRDGSILLLLVELFTGTKLKRERGKMKVHHLQNVRSAMDFLTDKKKIKIVGIQAEGIVAGNTKLTLGLIWTLILNFELSGFITMEEDCRPTSPQQISAKVIKDELLHWSTKATEGYDEVRTTNFHNSWKNGMAFCAIINRHRPDLLDIDECDPDKPLENLEKAFTIAETELGVIRFLDPEDVNVEKPSEQAVMMYVSALKQAFPDMPPPHRRKGPPISPDDYTASYKTLLNWIESRIEAASVDVLPSTAAEVSKLLKDFQDTRNVEDPEKKKEKEQVRAMAAEIKVFELKHKQDLRVPNIKELEEAWSKCMSVSDEYISRLKKEISRLEELDEIASKVDRECNSLSVQLHLIEEQIELIESEGGASFEEEEITELQGKLQSSKATLEGLETNIQVLKEGHHPQWSRFDEIVSGYWKTLSSLRSRLDGCIISVSDIQVLIAEADTKLRACEMWLLENGKFSDNQLIIEQKTDYETFNETVLADADDVMNRVNASLMTGHQEEVRELNKRWKQIQEQLKNRITNLATITETVTKFDAVKVPLQEWCVTQQEQHTLPLLETDLTELTKQKGEFEKMLSEVVSYEEAVEALENLSVDFLKHKEPIQSSADKYARRLRRISRNFADVSVKNPPKEETETVTLFQQSEILRSEFERNKGRIRERLHQASSLLQRLEEFEKKHTILLELIEESRALLEKEQPIGTTANRIEEQTNTCQEHRVKLSNAQSDVDSMLALGRSIISEYYTNPNKDNLSHKLTDFISDWSNLLMSWQNWYDELHATGEQSKNLSDQFRVLEQTYETVDPLSKELFPAKVSVDTLETDLKNLQDKFVRDVYDPLTSVKDHYESVTATVHLLTDKEAVERVLAKIGPLINRVESQWAELASLVTNVSNWWSECVAVRGKVTELREQLCEDLPLAGSLECIKKQDERVQNMLLNVEEMVPKLNRTVKHLSALTEQESLIVCKPVVIYRDELQHHWKEIFDQVESRRDVVEIGRVRLSVYTENRDPFAEWLSGAESRLKTTWSAITGVNQGKLVELTESLRAFKMDVEMHGHEMESCELMATKYCDTAKKYQSNLLVYRQKLHPLLSASGILPEHFFDWETEGFSVLSPNEGTCPYLHDSTYHNGLQVVGEDIRHQKKRFNQLKDRVGRRTSRFMEARDKKLAFQESLDSVLPKLEETESLLRQLQDKQTEASNKNLKEKLELMEKLEGQFSALRLLMDPLQLAAASWMVREPVDSENEDEEETVDECTAKSTELQNRYLEVEETMSKLREVLESSLAEAQAFQSSYSSFVSWLRDTERKIQKDDPLKLEITDLRSGLAYLKAVASDISSHTQPYEELCKKFQTAIEVAKTGEKDEQMETLENLESRWNSLQVIYEDIEAIKEAISLLEAFNGAYQKLMKKYEDLMVKFKQFSPSAITSDSVSKKKTEFESLLEEFNNCQAESDALFTQFDSLFNTLFEQTKFNQLVEALKSHMLEAKKLKDDKNRAMQHIVSRIKSLESSWAEFETWLTVSENEMKGLDRRLVADNQGNMTDHLHQAKILQDDVSDHESSIDSIESLVSSLNKYLEPHHTEKLVTRYNNLSCRYRCLCFSCEAFPVQVWLYNRTLELANMRGCAVVVSTLHSQIHQVKKYQTQLEDYAPGHLKKLKEVVSNLPQQFDLSNPEAKMAAIETRYTKLGKLCVQRSEVLASALPMLKLYEGSLDNWETVLKGWEESANRLAPPTTNVLIIQSTMENIKILLVQISNQEPEFHSLLREARQMYTGSEEQRLLFERLKTLCSPNMVIEQSDVKPGQVELQERLSNDQTRLDNLKQKVQSLLQAFSTLNDKSKLTNQLLNELLPWLREQLLMAKDLEIKALKYKTLEDQQNKCQAMAKDLQQREAQKDKLSDAFTDISTCLSPDCSDIISLKEKVDEVMQCWADLSSLLSKSRSALGPSTKLAKSFEGSQEKLLTFLKMALNELTGLGPIPSEPEAVHELRIRIDELKSNYNELIPLMRECTDDGHSLLKYSSDQTELRKQIDELESKWNTVGTMLTDIHQKLTDALVQTQEFQQVAESLDRWVNSTHNSLKKLDPVAVRVRLIEPQIEGLKPVTEDISINSATLDQVKEIGEQLLVEATTEERLKIGKKLHSLEARFYGLEKTNRTRMKELQDALVKATEFENSCKTLSNQLEVLEADINDVLTTPVRSQPLKALTEKAKEFNRTVLSHKPLVVAMATAETDLFQTDIETVKKYELRENFVEYLSSPQHSRGPSPYYSQSATPNATPTDIQHDSTIHPVFLDRPGALEVLESGARLNNRFEKLKFTSSRRVSELTSLLDTVLEYEENLLKFSNFLEKMVAKIQEQNMSMKSCEELKTELQKATSLQAELLSEEESLEAINITGTSLVDCCQDESSKDSVRESLSNLNDKWGTAQAKLDNRIEGLRKGVQLMDKYETMEREFQSWLSEMESKLDKPVTVTGSDTEMQQIVRKIENIQSDIDVHKPQLDTLVSTGEELESFAIGNAEASMPKLFLGYEDCRIRYQELLRKLNEKKSRTVDDVQKASELKVQLLALLDKLKLLKAQLDNHDPPHLLPEPVTEQIHNLESLNEEYKALEKDIVKVSQIASSFHLQDGSELCNLHNGVSTISQDIKDSLEKWRDKLAKARNSATHFDKDQKLFSQWVKATQDYLDNEEGLRATIEGVEKQMEALKERSEDISQHSQPLQKLMDQGRDMMMVGAAPEDCTLIGDCLAQIQSAYDNVQRHVYGKTQALKDGYNRVKIFNEEHEAVCSQLSGKEIALSMPFQVGTDVETVNDQLQDFKEFEAELAELKVKVSSCLAKGKQLKDGCHHEDKNKVEEKLEELNTAWKNLQVLSIARQQELENALLRLGQFREALLELMEWVNECLDGLVKNRKPGVDAEDLEQQMNDLKVLQSEIVSREPSVVSLNDASKQLLTASQDSDPSSIEIQREMSDLNQKWQELKSQAASQQLTLSMAHERARVFDNNLRQLMKQFNDAEEITGDEWKPHGLPSTCQQDIEDHRQLTAKVSNLKEPLANIKSEAQRLEVQASDTDNRNLSTRMRDLDDRLRMLLVALEDKQSQLEAAKDAADNFDEKISTLAEKLGNLEEQLGKPFAVFSEADEVKKQLEEHKVLLAELESYESEIGAVEVVGGVLIKQTQDGDTIKKELAKLRSQLDRVQSSALARLSDLEKALLTVGKFEEAYQELRGWLGQAWDKLQSLDPIPAHSESVAALIAKHKIFQKELSARSSSHNSVIKASKDLMKTKHGEDKSVLKGKMADVEHEWNAVDQMSTDYQQKLDNAIKKLRQFEPQAQNIIQWMKKILPTLDNAQPLDGDLETVQELFENHEAFQKQLGAHQKNIDVLVSLGEDILSTAVDDPSPLEENLEEIKRMWESLCKLSVEKQDRLVKARNNAIQFHQGVQTMWSWLEQKEAEIDLMAPPTEEEDNLQQQIQQHKMFEESVASHHSNYDGLVRSGENLLRVSHPRAEPILSGQLQQLQQKWKQLKDKMQSRNEALTSLLLEIHGLQDSIDELSDWVAAAEQDMASVEALPIGDDLDSVEDQLKTHESFQEEMAKHQPKMEALNKANKRRKSRVSMVQGSSSSPEITRKIGSLDKRWKKLWYRSNERHRQLLEARTRLKDIALARSFNFDAWCQRFSTWVDQQKLRVSDLFRRFDINHDGMLSREELMKGLKASGLAMNQIEMEKIADAFDRNKSGLIDLAEITAILKGQKVHKQYKASTTAKPASDTEKIDLEIKKQVAKCCCEHRYQVVPVKAGHQYKFGDSQKLRMVRILRSTVMVRVGGGWEPLDTFLSKNDPCRVSGRTNTDIMPTIGLGKVTFKSKVQTMITSKEAMKLAEHGGTVSKADTKSVHSGRQETVVTKKHSVPQARTVTTSTPGNLQRTSTGTSLGAGALKRPTTPSRKTSSLSRYMSPPNESQIRPLSRPRTPSGYSSRPTTADGSLSVSRPKTPSRNTNGGMMTSNGTNTEGVNRSRPPSRTSATRLATPSTTGGSRIPTPSTPMSRIPTPSTRTKPNPK